VEEQPEATTQAAEAGLRRCGEKAFFCNLSRFQSKEKVGEKFTLNPKNYSHK
jgi:hypothetical protein